MSEGHARLSAFALDLSMGSNHRMLSSVLDSLLLLHVLVSPEPTLLQEQGVIFLYRCPFSYSFD